VNETPIYYSLIQVVPDPVRGERMNVGVVAWDPTEGVGVAKFSRSRQRLKALGIENVGFVTEFESWLASTIPAPTRRRRTSNSSPSWSLEQMQHAALEWGGMIQLTSPRPSIGGTVDKLVQEIYERAVFVHKAAVDPESGREAIRKSAAQIVRHSLRERYQAHAPVQVVVSSQVPGRLYAHVFDVVVLNGDARGVLVTPNFSDKRTEQVRRDLDAAAWAISDVRDRHDGPTPEFAILRASNVRPALSDQLDAIVEALHVAPLQREDLGRWATEDVPAAAHV
jgi:hypothetical protein